MFKSVMLCVAASVGVAMGQNYPPAGYAMRFNGTNAFVAVADHPLLDFDRTATIEFWVKAESLQTPGDSIRLLIKGDGISCCSDMAFSVECNTTATGAGFHYQGGGYSSYPPGVTPPPQPTLNAWLHYAFTFDANTQVFSSFVNGVLNSSFAIESRSIRNSSRRLTIGGDPNWNLMLTGSMDEVRLWNIARTPAQIASSYNTTVPANSPGLVAYYSFDEGAGTSVQDRTGHGLNGVVNGGATWVQVVPPCTAPSITTQPVTQSVCSETSLNLAVTATGTTPQFQWRKNGVNISGANGANYFKSSASVTDSGSYDCVVSNACGTVTTAAANVTVRLPQILSQPTSQSVNVDQPVFFVVETNTASPCQGSLNYRWQRRNAIVADPDSPNAWIELNDGGGFVGTAAPTLAILRPTPGLATGYRCKITNACGCEADANGVIYTNTVNFSAACPSDFNLDGAIDGDDIISFFNRWDGGC